MSSTGSALPAVPRNPKGRASGTPQPDLVKSWRGLSRLATAVAILESELPNEFADFLRTGGVTRTSSAAR